MYNQYTSSYLILDQNCYIDSELEIAEENKHILEIFLQNTSNKMVIIFTLRKIPFTIHSNFYLQRSVYIILVSEKSKLYENDYN